MRFVVATHQYLLLVTVNEALDVTDCHVLDRGYFDGADVGLNGIICAIRKTEPWSGSSPGEILWYDAEGPHESLQPLDASDVLDPHQITFDPSGRAIWCTSTGNNSVVLKPIHMLEDQRRYRFFNPEGHDDDWNHINSVFVEPDTVSVWFVFHNLGFEPSRAMLYARNNMKIFLTSEFQLAHEGVHNIIVDDDYLYYNASDDGSIIRCPRPKADADPSNPLVVENCPIEEKWHPKGMAEAPGLIVSGYSEHAVDTLQRFTSESGLCFVDRESWDLRKLAPILCGGKTVGNINEIRYYDDKS